ncbi:MAG: hypothetical protein JXA90_04695, partial [Planctomycetes bacterium]|nr:hypothetical protein [Planctomycetota bacterium]
MTLLLSSAESSAVDERPARDDILFEDFEKETYEGWTVTGTAFGAGPIEKSKIPAYQGDVGGAGKRVVNSHNVRQGEDVGGGDRHVGTLTSREFRIERRYINFFVGGGAHEGKTCVQLLVDGQAVRAATGRNDNRMLPAMFDVAELAGQTARIRIIDAEPGGWGNIGVDHIVFSDRPASAEDLDDLHDHGTMALALLGALEGDLATASVGESGSFLAAVEDAHQPLRERLSGSLGRRLELSAGESGTVSFVLTWHFPNLSVSGYRGVGRHYAARFGDAAAVARYVARHFERLEGETRRWRNTWYDSSLPFWFLDRTMANTTTLATSTCYRFLDGRFWAWEGIGCCPGTCTHVWHYAQAMGRLFPELERDLRERTDFGIGFDETTGVIGHRGELYRSPAHDGQAGSILRTYREHQMSPDSAFLERLWPRVRKAIEYLIERDENDDGVIEGSQPNTLDAAWFGKISFLVSLYLAALHAGEAMAVEMGDEEFAARCRKIADRGRESILDLFNGEYFIQIEDPARLDAIGVGGGCYIDQVFGQSWAFQVGLGRLFDQEKILSALRSLWKYSFVPDVGPFREKFERGRWYAAAGDAGLLMCTWPKGGRRADWEKHWQYGYFNECMSGFEWQVAAHMIWEGMMTEGLGIARAIHDRYDGSLRNPYNEIECSDHYARAMASYGAFLAACGWECHGPRGYLAFAPRLGADSFRAAFTAAEAWGTISQRREKE